MWTIHRSVIAILFLCGAIEALRSVNKPLFGKIKKKIKTYKTTQETILKKLDNLETELTGRINNLTVRGVAGQACAPTIECKGAQVNMGDINLDNLETRLDGIEADMDEIMRYLSREKDTDVVLKSKSDKVITKMKGKVQKTENVIVELQDTVSNKLETFEEMIHEVNRSAQVTINSKGVIFYSEIGSTCSLDDECLTENSECRSGKCQCIPGWSYNMEDRSCVEVCDDYGLTYQTANNYYIRGYNDLILENVTSLDECKETCETEASFLCKSIDYFPRWKSCYLSSSTKLDAPDAYKYNGAGMHLQRDCK